MGSPSSTFTIVAIAVIIASLAGSEALHVRIGTRSSKLAMAQAQMFQSAFLDRVEGNGSNGVTTEIVCIDSEGDKGNKAPIQQLPLAVSGVDFTGTLDGAVANEKVDVAIHSLKDIPPDCRWDSRLTIGAYLGPRANPLDVLITKDHSIESIQGLPRGARVGSASMRRQAQLKSHRPDIRVINLRGNVDARLGALYGDEVDALVLACAGLERLGIISDGNEDDESDATGGYSIKKVEKMNFCYNLIPIETMLPGLGQGVVAVSCRSDNAELLSLLHGSVDHYEARISALVERAFLDTLQRLSPWTGRPPVAGCMRPTSEDRWTFDGLLATPDGARVLRVHDTLGKSGCDEETAHMIGRAAGEKVIKIAGADFLDGFH